uniref:SFRICE_030212 n=1 Tax=Spodoptera frugiperda TaxID=7108 RepID=A0A2H1VLG8_SPOFR
MYIVHQSETKTSEIYNQYPEFVLRLTRWKRERVWRFDWLVYSGRPITAANALSFRISTKVYITARNATIKCTPTFYHLHYKFRVIGGEPTVIYWAQFQTLLLRNFQKSETFPVILCPTRESKLRLFFRQSHLRRGSQVIR